MVENVFAFDAPHHRDDYRCTSLNSEEGAGVRDVGRAAKEGDFHVRLRGAEVGKNCKGLSTADAQENFAESGCRATLKDVNGSVEAVHP